MDQIIDMIAVKVTEKRWILLGALDIKWQSIEADLPTCTSIKMRTTTCLNSWFTEQHFNYWKYQMLLMAFRECQLVPGVENIIEKFKIKGKFYNQLAIKDEDVVKKIDTFRIIEVHLFVVFRKRTERSEKRNFVVIY